MSNSFFQFKQFIVHQENCAMKVSTEACILGAWIKASKPNRILDIGTGTGLLSLMLAQKIAAPIDAIELDKNAANQAKENVQNSNWKDRIDVINDNVFEWANVSNQTYDLIVSNPPFFTNNQKSEQHQKNLAKHDTSTFNKENLAAVLKKLLTEKGNAFILYPEYESEQFKAEVEKLGMFYQPSLMIRNQPNGPVFRIISMISKVPIDAAAKDLNIREGREHSKEFTNLLSPYYLKY